MITVVVGGEDSGRFRARLPANSSGSGGFVCRRAGAVFRVPCSGCRVPCSVFRVPCSVFRVPKYPGARYPGARCPVP